MYHLTCECGSQIAAQELEFVCSKCKRILIIRWHPVDIKERFYTLFGDYAKPREVRSAE